MRRSALDAVLSVALCLGLTFLLAACNNDSNNPPIANAGADQTSNVLVGDVVVLDGSASSDADGDTLLYRWVLKTVPPNSTATLSDPFSDKPTFVTDLSGSYVAQLTVNDGKTDSMADDVNVTVVVPPPTVTITTPEPQSLVTTSTVTVAGTVDDPLAVVTVNGNATPNSNGSYSADLTLPDGSNTITVVATNTTGAGSASVDVVVKTVPGPVVTITSPQRDFTAGVALDSNPGVINIPVQVNGIITTENTSGTPTVMVHDGNGPPGVAATIALVPPNPLLVPFCNLFPNSPICDQLQLSRYSFSATLDLSRGDHTITAAGSDTLGGSAQAQVSGVADYCLIGKSDGTALRGNGQNNRCHEIDGCNRNKFGLVGDTDTNSLRNLPMPNAIYNSGGPIRFGSGYIPPTDPRNDFFVHGQGPRDPLGCNIHDTRYQTCAPGDAARVSAYSAANLEQYNNHVAECRKHYPPTCPYSGLFDCKLWANEKQTCWNIADIYWRGVSSGGGWDRYLVRQNDYCANP